MMPLLSENSTGTSAYMLLEIGLRDGRKLRPSPRMEKKLAIGLLIGEIRREMRLGLNNHGVIRQDLCRCQADGG